MLFAAASAARKIGLLGVLAAVLAASPWAIQARQTHDDVETQVVALSDLPRNGRAVHALILAGGPFPHDKDGVVFGNRERLLPVSKRGYYREYTVRTPGVRHRGARRIVCGGVRTRPDACYYTADHYASFRRIVD